MMNQRVVVTGIGIVSPSGNGTDITWQNLKHGKNAVHKITKFDTTEFRDTYAGEVTIDATDYISPRLAKKMDPFSLYSLVACSFAIDDSGIDLDSVDRDRIGTFVGNSLGGWTYTDPQLRMLHTSGIKGLSPFLASAWFPAAPQGQITIYFKLRGFSKTIDCGRASGSAAIGYGVRAIEMGRSDVLLAGGTEAIIAPYTMTGCSVEGITEPGHRSAEDGCYRPFDSNRKGWVPGEGATFLMLESLDHALSRNATIYCEVTGFGSATNPCHPLFLPLDAGATLAKAMARALSEAQLNPSNINLVMADSLGTWNSDLTESIAIKEVVSETVPVTAPKSMMGHLYGASGALDIALAALSIKKSCILPTINVENPDPDCGLNIVMNEPINSDLDNVLINNRGNGGIASSLIISRFNSKN